MITGHVFNLHEPPLNPVSKEKYIQFEVDRKFHRNYTTYLTRRENQKIDVTVGAMVYKATLHDLWIRPESEDGEYHQCSFKLKIEAEEAFRDLQLSMVGYSQTLTFSTDMQTGSPQARAVPLFEFTPNKMEKTIERPMSIGLFQQSPTWDHKDALEKVVSTNDVAWVDTQYKGDGETITHISLIVKREDEENTYTELAVGEQGWEYVSDVSIHSDDLIEPRYHTLPILRAMERVVENANYLNYNP